MLDPAQLGTLIVIGAVLVLLVATQLPADVVLVGGVVLLLVGGVLEPVDALAGLANPGVATIGALFVVARGLQETGAVDRVASSLLGRRSSLRVALARMILPVSAGSAFLNNTPIVAALLPGVSGWARRNGAPLSRLLLPLSYASILGGTCTLIGTSTNLVVHGLAVQAAATHPALVPPGMFTSTWVGLPLTLLGGAVLVALAPVLLPDRRPALSVDDDPREYTMELAVPPGSPLVGRTIAEADLRHLQHGFLAELVRGDKVLAAVGPEERLEAGDRLVFVGALESMVDLQRTRGLAPAVGSTFESPRGERQLVEAVVAPSNPLVGRTIRDGRFRDRYNAAVLAVARDGHRLTGKIGDMSLRPGDVLLLETRPEFLRTYRNRRDFHLVSGLRGASPGREARAPVALLLLALMVGAATFELLSMLEASLLAAGGMVATGCCSPAQARRSVDASVLLAIAAAFGLGKAMQLSGLDGVLADLLMSAGASGPLVALAATYLATAALTELITNNAAAVLAFPLALSLADRLGVSPQPFVIAVMIGASASFLTPIGYQTNLMVYGPGGYRFTDYLRIGWILSLLGLVLTLLIAPWVWPF
ncbi:MAG: SLC13 family permease [Alphaproteobacteria bacterium]|nr:SLC13 family permease [Alphaproteobacteria bacterium]